MFWHGSAHKKKEEEQEARRKLEIENMETWKGFVKSTLEKLSSRLDELEKGEKAIHADIDSIGKTQENEKYVLRTERQTRLETYNNLVAMQNELSADHETLENDMKRVEKKFDAFGWGVEDKFDKLNADLHALSENVHRLQESMPVYDAHVRACLDKTDTTANTCRELSSMLTSVEDELKGYESESRAKFNDLQAQLNHALRRPGEEENDEEDEGYPSDSSLYKYSNPPDSDHDESQNREEDESREDRQQEEEEEGEGKLETLSSTSSVEYQENDDWGDSPWDEPTAEDDTVIYKPEEDVSSESSSDQSESGEETPPMHYSQRGTNPFADSDNSENDEKGETMVKLAKKRGKRGPRGKKNLAAGAAPPPKMAEQTQKSLPNPKKLKKHANRGAAGVK